MTAVRRPRAYVLDSWAVLAYLQGEPSAQETASLLADAVEQGIPLHISVINAGEVWYIMARELTVADADEAIADVRRWGVEFVDADWALAQQAAAFKSRHKMSYADAFAVALAKSRKAELVTGDPELGKLGQEVQVRWMGKEKTK